jgi:type I restriction enzyme S subunit
MAGEYPITQIGELASSISDTHKFGKEQLVFLNTSDILHGKFLHRTYSAVKDWPGQAKKSIRKDDILFSEIRPANGRWAYVEENADDFVVSTKLMVIRAKQDRLFPKFLYQFLTSSEITKWLQHLAESRSGTFPQITFDQVATLELPLPPLAEQKAIAAVLGALDDKIELNRRMNATLEAMARALFQSWFIDFDPVRANLDRNQPSPAASRHPLPLGEGRGEGRFALDPATAALFPEHLEDSPLGHIPKGWTAGKLGDIATNSRRGVQPGDIAQNTPYIALEHMPRRCIALGDWTGSADVASGKSAFKKGEILFGKLRPYFHKVGVAPFDGVCSTDILVLAPKGPEWFGFLLGHASSDELIQFTDLASTGTKMPRTNWSDISSFKVALPPKPIAAAFTRNIQPMLDRITANLHQSRTLATLRDTLLPKLLSGELSVAESTSTLSNAI